MIFLKNWYRFYSKRLGNFWGLKFLRPEILMTRYSSLESITHLGHYGLIANVFSELEISDLIGSLVLYPRKELTVFYYKCQCLWEL